MIKYFTTIYLLLAVTVSYNNNDGLECESSNPPSYNSYTISLIYNHRSINRRKTIESIIEQFKSEFKDIKNCSNLKNKTNCIVGYFKEPTEEYYEGRFTVIINKNLFSKIGVWFALNKKELDVFIIPNSACKIKDRTKNIIYSVNNYRPLKLNEVYK